MTHETLSQPANPTQPIASQPEGQRVDPQFVNPQPENGSPFEMPSFHQCWWRYLSPRFDIPVKGQALLIHRKKVARGLLTLKEARISGWNTAWHQALSDDRIRELHLLKQTSAWDYFRVRMQAGQDLSQITERLTAPGFPCWLAPAPFQYSIDLSQGLETYLKGLSHNSRKSLKKKTRLAQALKPTLVTVSEAKAVDQFLEELIQHHIHYWDQKAGYSYLNQAEEKRFLYEWVLALHQSGHLVLERLLMDEQTVNLSLGVRSDNTFYWLFTVNTGLFSNYAPGIVGLYLRLEAYAQQNIQQFHMGPGDYFYKIQSANLTLPCVDLYIINPNSWKGLLYHQWLKRKHGGNINRENIQDLSP